MNNRKHELLSRFHGEYCCRKNENLTLNSDTAGLTGLFGYSKEEFQTKYHNSLRELITFDYREEFSGQLEQQLGKGNEVELVFPAVRKDGTCVWILNRAMRYFGDDGQEYLLGVLVEFTRIKQDYDVQWKMNQALKEQAEQDSLTKIYNARTARKLAETYMAEKTSPKCVLLIIDLDDFKQVNDRYGHLFGDAVLVQAARAIKKLFRNKDIVGRIGGEEFLVLMKDVTDAAIVNQRCSQINEAFHEIMKEQLQDRKLSCSIGVAFAPEHGTTYFELFCDADQALYQAKDLGKDRYVFYDPGNSRCQKEKPAHKFADYDAEVFRGYIDI